MSKVDGAMYKCDRCGETKFVSCRDLSNDGGLSAHGVYKLSVSKRVDMHICEPCYLRFCDWLEKKDNEN